MGSFLLLVLIAGSILQIAAIRDLNRTIKEIPQKVCDLMLSNVKSQIISLKEKVEEINVEINQRK